MNRLGYILPAIALLCATAAVAAKEQPPAYCQLRVATEPAGASVVIDGQPKDITPTVITDILPGEHLLVVTKAGYRDLRRTLTLKPDQREALDLKLEPLSGLVLVTSTPEAADVQIKDASRGKTPCFFTDLPVGKHRLTLSAPGYQPKTVDIDIKDRKPMKVDVDLLSDSAALSIRTEPAGASVTINGVDAGTTPCTVDRVDGGEATLRITLQGYKPHEQTVKLRTGRKEEISVTLAPLPAELTVVTIPDKARVYIENQFRGESPVTATNLPPGAYRVRAELPGHDALSRTVTLKEGDHLVEEFRLEVNAGILELVTEPPGVHVTIDGKDSGDTVPRLDSDGVSQPLTVNVLEAGPHTIQLHKDGYFAKKFTVEIKKDETVTARQKLLRRFEPDMEVQTSTGVERGVLQGTEPNGNLRLEIRPGIFKIIQARDIISKRPLTPAAPAGN